MPSIRQWHIEKEDDPDNPEEKLYGSSVTMRQFFPRQSETLQQAVIPCLLSGGGEEARKCNEVYSISTLL